LVDQRHRDEKDLKTLVAPKHGEDRAARRLALTDWVFQPQRREVLASFDSGVYQVGEKHDGQ
jgi:hypothetical protein